MPKYILETLFDSKLRLKVLKFLFRNANTSFNLKELALHVQETPPAVKHELKRMLEIGLVKMKKK